MYLRLLLLAGLVLFFFTSNGQDTTKVLAPISPDKVLDDKNSLPQPDAEAMIKRYRDKRWKRMRRAGIFGKRYDAGSCWFDIKRVRKFEDEINAYLAARTDRPSKVSGFRYYYIMYKKNDPHAPARLRELVGSTKKIHSILIVATEDIDGVQTDVIDPRTKRVAALTVVLNEGTLCPPLPLSECKGATLAKDYYNQ
jgi:hypothetical protein